MTSLTPKQEELCATSRWDFSDLRAVYINCTLKRSPEISHTQGLADRSITIMERNGVTVEQFRAVDEDIATGVWPDMTEHGWERDGWPAIFERVIAADILVLFTPIWLGEKSSVCTQVIERLYGNSHLLNDAGQYAYYGRVGGCLVTGNEDGIKHCAMNILYSLQHLGYTIPPQADAGWIGEAGPGPSYLDAGVGRARQRLHEPQHDVHDVEPAARGTHAQGRRRRARARQPALGVGRGRPLRLPEPGAPLMPLQPLPPGFATSVAELHRVAEEVVSPARKPDNEIALEATPGGFGTPEFEWDGSRRQVRVDGAELVYSADGKSAASRWTSTPRRPPGSPTGTRSARIVLGQLVADAAAEEAASPVRLWPEHFDIAIELGEERAGRRANYGFSPGDEDHPEPYAYVGPWTAEVAGDLWGATGFRGAELTYAELLAAPDPRAAALEFFTTRKEALA